ncbi:MAG: hypothetical protein J4O14_08025 [Chloroflexi bacterium]|nr:hypothetical protein [Chloroflexota bacterium]
MNVSDAVSNRWVLATAGAVFGVILALTLIGRASGGFPEPQCENLTVTTVALTVGDTVACIELAPESDTNTVGSEHVVTATVTSISEDPKPIEGVDVVVLVIDGPSAGALAVGTTDVNGMLSLTYTGAEPGTDEIGALACFEPLQIGLSNGVICDVQISEFIEGCLAVPTVCLSNVTDPSGLCSGLALTICDTATKDWVEPTPVIWADNNCKDGVNPVDSLFVLRGDAGLQTDTGDCPDMGQGIEVLNASPHIWGDVDCTGDMSPVDSLKVLRFDAGLSASQEEGCPEMGSSVTITEL